MVRITERAIFTIVSVILAFLYLSFDPQMTNTFLLFLFISGFLFLMDKNVTYIFEKNPSQRYADILIGIVSALGFFALASVLLPILGLQSSQSILSLFSSNLLFSQYILAGKTILVVLSWGFLIPIVEHIFVTRLFEGMLDIFKTRPDIKNIATWLAFSVVSVGMALFHIQAKGGGIEALPALFITALFFAISFIVIVIRGQILPGAVMHITANTLAIKDLVPEFIIPPVVLIAGGALLLILALRTQKIRRILGRL